jgi:hypothetical protein
MLAHVTTLSCQEPSQGCEVVAAAPGHCSTEEALPSILEAHVQDSETYRTFQLPLSGQKIDTNNIII